MLVDWIVVTSYIGYVLAVILCWGLGPIFRIPMLINMGFNLSLNLGLLSGWDIRGVIAVYGLAFFLWVLALTQSINRLTLVFLLLLDLTVVFCRVLPDIQTAGIGGDFWNTVSTHIVEVWMASIFGLSATTIFRSTLLAKWRHRRMDLLTNPRKRFIIPICVWSGTIAITPWLGSFLPQTIIQNRFALAAELLVWGWVAVELPFYLLYRRLTRIYS